MNKSESIKSLATALSKAQAEMNAAQKKSDNPFFKSKYADLSQVLDCVKTAFSSHGLSFTQMPSFNENKVYVETLLMHSSGEWISSTCGSPIKSPNAQGVGDAITYLRRYSLASVAGLSQKDDDGNSNSAHATPEKPYYDRFDKDEERMIEALTMGKTADDLIKSIQKTCRISKENKDKIIALGVK